AFSVQLHLLFHLLGLPPSCGFARTEYPTHVFSYIPSTADSLPPRRRLPRDSSVSDAPPPDTATTSPEVSSTDSKPCRVLCCCAALRAFSCDCLKAACCSATRRS